jgi:5'-nucleotidase (lipoprotein e(P4) family)
MAIPETGPASATPAGGMCMTRTGIPFVCALMLVGGAGCRTSAPAPAPAVAPARTAAADPRGDPDSIRWVRDSAEYQAAALQAYRAATARVETEAGTRTPGTWGVVLDADETVISNLQYQVERARAGLGFTPESWRAWVARRAATPLPGAASFLSRTRELGGRIAIVTNRLASECPDTQAEFRAQGLAYDVMLCRPDDGPSDKNPRFKAVADGTTSLGGPPLEIVAFVGDNIQDFPGLRQTVRQKGDAAFADFGVRYFVIPNPMYGSWQ